MATVTFRCLLPGLTGYSAGDLELAIFDHEGDQDDAALLDSISLTPDAEQDDMYWGTGDTSFSGVVRGLVTETTTVRGSGYFKLDGAAGTHDMAGDPYIANALGTLVSVDVDIGSLMGTGADQCTIRVLISGVPVADADVWITSDAAGSIVVAGTLQTDSEGKRMFMLDAGNEYYLWAQKDGVNSINGELFTAVAD